MLRIEVAWAAPHTQHVIGLRVPAGTTVEQAIRRSGLVERFPEIDLEKHGVGRSRHPASTTAPGVALPPASMQSSRDTSTFLYVGIFGELAGLDDSLRDGDRIEIYRPLLADPKTIRRERAMKRKKGK
ncbi:MAG: RnfH family protein [Pseudomonadota bacterium]